MSTRKTTLFYAMLIAVASVAVGMVIASRLELSPTSSAQTVSTAMPPANSAPLSGPVDAATFRTIAKAMSPTVVNIRTESRQKSSQMTQFFGGDDDLLERFFGGGNGAHLDDYETKDERRLMPGTGFTIEPGLYFDDFGVRLEIDMLVRDKDAIVTGPVQREIVALA